MHRFFPPKTNSQLNEAYDMGSNYPRRLTSRTKSSSVVVPNLKALTQEKNENTRYVRVRLVFIHIGKRNESAFVFSLLKIFQEILIL
jgi:hypothetical protein